MRSGAVLLLLLGLPACTRGETKTAEAGSAASASATTAHPIARPKDAAAELGVLTDAPHDELAVLIAPASLGAILEARHCGPPTACDRVRAALRDPKTVEIALERTDDWGLPPDSTLDAVARGLSPAERASLHKRPTVVVVRAHAAPGPEHVAARAAFALTAAIAERAHGIVYDETLRRIETAAEFGAHAITAPLGDPAFRDDRIVIQLYQQEDGTARLVSLGMRRFGAPDLEVRGASAGAGRSLGGVMNAVAARLAAGAVEAPLVVRVDDKSATVDLVVPPREEGDPDNAIVRVVPAGGATPAGYDDLSRALVGASDPVIDTTNDAELAAARARALKSFPAALARWKSSPAPRPTLMVKLPFPLPGDAGVEWMWVDVKRADEGALYGTLANTPAYATDLSGGAAVKGARKDLADWLMKLPDGGTEGGETIRILEARPR